MKLYLTSYRLPVPEELFRLLKKSPHECRVAIIPNAKDYKLPEERGQSLDELLVYLSGWGFRCDVIDLREYSNEPELLKETLTPYDVLFLAGGDAFMLRYEIGRSGLDKLLSELPDDMVLVGESAGAIVAGTSLEGSEIADKEILDEDNAEGLGLVDKLLVPHADNPEFLEYANAMRKRWGDDPSVQFLNDNQALIVEGGQQKLVTAS